MYLKHMAILGTLAIAGLGLIGCGKSEKTNLGTPTKAVSSDGHAHGGWWCDEHGMPEAICAQCSTEVAAKLKAEGDWCREHDRPESQCFICHPELQAKFATQYEAKYGKQPPKPSETEEK
jgi:hypothetical protein